MVAYSFNKRFVYPIRVGLSKAALSFDCTPKRQTIRAIGKRRHVRPGETVQLYHGMRTKHCFKIGEALCVEVQPVQIVVGEHSLPIRINGTGILGGLIHDFARADGFANGEDMLAFWKEKHGLGVFSGVLIKWEPL